MVRARDGAEQLRVTYIGSLFSYKGAETIYAVSRLVNYSVDLYCKDFSMVPPDIAANSKTDFVPHDFIGDLLLDYEVGFVLLENTNTRRMSLNIHLPSSCLSIWPPDYWYSAPIVQYYVK